MCIQTLLCSSGQREPVLEFVLRCFLSSGFCCFINFCWIWICSFWWMMIWHRKKSIERLRRYCCLSLTFCLLFSFHIWLLLTPIHDFYFPVNFQQKQMSANVGFSNETGVFLMSVNNKAVLWLHPILSRVSQGREPRPADVGREAGHLGQVTFWSPGWNKVTGNHSRSHSHLPPRSELLVPTGANAKVNQGKTLQPPPPSPTPAQNYPASPYGRTNVHPPEKHLNHRSQTGANEMIGIRF